MLSKLIVKPVENLMGIGKILDRDELISSGQYNINILQEVHIYEIKEIREEVEGQKIMEGNIAVLEKGISLCPSDHLTLHLEDGREIGFTVYRSINRANNRYEIRSYEDLYWK